VILLIGSFTGTVGDPTGRLSTRQQLTREKVIYNSREYKKQAGKILDINRAKIKYNHKWWDKMKVKNFIELATNFTAQQILARDMFKERMTKDKELYLHELLYPLLQAYDSVIMGVDGEIGGNDQTFNMLAGRALMKKIKNKEKFVLTTKLLKDPTGKKMGKTEGNMITLTDEPNKMFGKVMSWPDELILPGFELCTRVEMSGIREGVETNPRKYKAELAREVVKIYHGEQAAEKAVEEFDRIFKEKKIPSEIRVVKVGSEKINILDLLMEIKLVESKSDARRLVEENAVRINEDVIKNWQEQIIPEKDMIVQVGKKRFVRLDIK